MVNAQTTRSLRHHTLKQHTGRKKREGQTSRRCLCHFAGFTLLEVLVALAIVAVAGTAAMALSGDLLRRMGDARLNDQVALLAWSTANREMETLTHPSVRTGTFDAPYEQCTWQARTERLQLGAATVSGTGAIESGTTAPQPTKSAFIARITVQCDDGAELTVERLGGF